MPAFSQGRKKRFRNLGKADVAIIGGCGLEALLEGTRMHVRIAPGIQQQLNASAVAEVAKDRILFIQQILKEAIEHLPQNRRCLCVHAHGNASFEVE